MKTPKSGSERLELVLENSHWHDEPQQVDDSREPDNFDYYSDPPTWERREDACGYNHNDDNGREIVQSPSGHSASTCETDNTSSNKMSGNISRTWSIASDDGRAPEQPKEQVVIQNIARNHMDAINEEINLDYKDPVETQPDDENDGFLLVGTNNLNEPSGEAVIEDELLGSITRDFDEMEQCEGSMADDKLLDEPMIEPTQKDELIESHLTSLPLPMRKAVSFDESHNSEFDFDIDEPAQGGREDDRDDDDEVVEQESTKSTLKAQLSTDTSVESVGYRVTTTWSKETVTSPKSALREPKYTSNSSVGSGGNDSSGDNSKSSQHSTRRNERNNGKSRKSPSPSPNHPSRLAASEMQGDVASRQSPPPRTELSRRKKSPFQVSQSGISDISIAGSGYQSSNASLKPLRDADSEAEMFGSSNPNDLRQSMSRRQPPENQCTPSRKVLPQAGQFLSIPRSPSTFSAGAQSNVALDGYVEQEDRPKRQGFFSIGKKSRSDRYDLSANKKKSLFTQSSLLRRNTKKGETPKPGRVFSLKRNKSTKPQRDRNAHNIQTNDKGVSTGSLSSRATNPSPFEEDARIINRRNRQTRDSNTTMDHRRTMIETGSNPRMKEKENNSGVRTTLSPKSLSNDYRRSHQGTQTTNFASASGTRSPRNHNPWANQEVETNAESPPKSELQQNYNPWANGGTTSASHNPFSGDYDAKNPPEGSYNLKGAGMPAIKWWTWKQPDEEDAAKDCRYCALLCMFPPED